MLIDGARKGYENKIFRNSGKRGIVFLHRYGVCFGRYCKSKGYDNVAIDTFAYRYTRTVPNGIVPEDNVIVRLRSIDIITENAPQKHLEIYQRMQSVVDDAHIVQPYTVNFISNVV